MGRSSRPAPRVNPGRRGSVRFRCARTGWGRPGGGAGGRGLGSPARQGRLVPGDQALGARWDSACHRSVPGALGEHVARWLAGLGAEHLVLVSRRGGDAPGAAELEAELLELGVGVTIAACDVADHDALAALVGRGRLAAQAPPIRTVVHAAGVGGSGSGGRDHLGAGRVRAQGCPGVDNLARLLGPQLDTFVLFSSGCRCLGEWDARRLRGRQRLPRRRRARVAAAWRTSHLRRLGVWAGDGMGADDVGRELRRRGILGMSPTRALRELRGVLERDETTAVIADIRWADFVPAFASRRDSPLLARIVAEIGGDETGDQSSALLTQLAGLPDNERIETCCGRPFGSTLQAVLGYADPGEVRLDATFQEIGFDSIAVVGSAGGSPKSRGCGWPPPPCSTTRPRTRSPGTCANS